MKRFLLLVTLVGLDMGTYAADRPAQAQSPIHVLDDSALVQSVKGYLQELKGYATQLQQLQQEVQTTVQTGQMLYSMATDPSLATVMQAANMLGLDPSLPISPYAVQGIIAGRGNIAGLPSQLSGLINTTSASNNVYTCTDTSWACQQQNANAKGLSGTQGLAMQLFNSAAAHAPILNEIRSQLSNGDTQATRDHAAAELQAEQAWVAQQQLQATTIMVMAQSQRDLREEQANEKLNKDLTATIASIPGG